MTEQEIRDEIEVMNQVYVITNRLPPESKERVVSWLQSLVANERQNEWRRNLPELSAPKLGQP